MFWYACNETKEYMPAPIYYAHMLALQLTRVRRANANSPIKPDGKTQVSVEYKDGKVKRIDTIIVSTQHSADITQDALKEIIMNEVIKPVIDESLVDENT